MVLRSAIVVGLLFAATPSVFAGFIATTGVNAVSTPAGSLAGPQVGDTFATSAPGTLTTYTPFTPADPQLDGVDLSNYRYDLNGTVTSVNLALGYVTYAGSYDIYYNLGGTGPAAPDIAVSEGTFSILAAFTSGTNNATLTGTLIQSPSFSVPAPFADLSYGGNPVVYTGVYDGTNPGVSGTIQGSLIQTAAFPSGGLPSTPEPASLGLLALGATALMARRRAAR